ncbi:MAG: hypothetical protein K2Y09_01400 [Nitrosomonas sp.]|uniref:hypothetical protein n=1 Tax=Nitrosomonas sp. TaxID=42353 RepID=UPI001D33A1EF|nr:hypothetical protein [Nitrosomonas sp.]MBX9893825.1 hypothetical protein [Nitrosomonas sp.]
MNDTGNCNKSKFKPPVKWLLGRELLAGLKLIAAYTFMGDKQDPKDWMKAAVIQVPHKDLDQDAYWFDFIADTGDGMRAVYNIGYLCMSDLWVAGSTGQCPEDAVALSGDAIRTQRLPRGEFLFVGGDTAYHVADTASLMERFQIPFNCAYDDLIKNGQTVGRRPIYGIPANHDYYDALDGFNRQFREPVSLDTGTANDEKDPQLGLKGFVRTQQASYVDMQLPFGWRLWGLDSQDGKMDKRQQAFFVSGFCKKLVETGELFDSSRQDAVQQELQQHAPSKLIVVTPEPSTVFGKWAKPDGALVNTFQRLGLEASFIESHAGKLDDAKCRLDIAGDTHHYERYWGSGQNEAASVNYASVVAGGGGAFLHPSHTDVAEVTINKYYPHRKDSHQLFTRALLNPLTVWQGGYIWLFGGLVALLSYFAVTIPQSTASVFQQIFSGFHPALANNDGLLSRIQSALHVDLSGANASFFDSGYCLHLIAIGLFAALLLIMWRAAKPPEKTDESTESGKLQQFMAKVTAPVVSLEVNLKADADAWRKSIVLFMVPVPAGMLLLMLLMMNHDQPHPLMAGLLMVMSGVAAVLLLCLSRRYRDILNQRNKIHRETPVFPAEFYEKIRISPEMVFEALPFWGYGLLSIAYLIFGMLRYGAYSTSVMTFNLLIIIVWLFMTAGLIAVAYFWGGQLFSKVAGKIRLALIAAWCSFLLLTVPVCLALYANWMHLLIVAAAVAAVTLLAGRIFTLDRLVKKDFPLSDQTKLGYCLLAVWSVVGIFTLIAATQGALIETGGWRLLAAFLAGAIFSCIWLGWYFAVALAFNGHNNEAGGGSRSERYRHMIRFKLTQDSLTGYVIGIDQPVEDFTREKSPVFRLVDVFTIRCNGGNPGNDAGAAN